MGTPDYVDMSHPMVGYYPSGYVPYQSAPAQPVLGGTPLLTLPPCPPVESMLQNVQVTCMFSSSPSGGGLDVYAK